MVVVKDTESFIRRAREVHGDRYDYSVSVWSGANRPIVIACKKHGAFELRQAGSHYKKNKNCGCLLCSKHNPRPGAGRKRTFKICFCCGQSVPSSSIKPSCGVCEDCWCQFREMAVFEYRKKACGCCGSWFYPHSVKNKNCEQCRYRKQLDNCRCVVCGKSFCRSQSKLNKNENNYCGIECYSKATKATIDVASIKLPVLHKCLCGCGRLSTKPQCTWEMSIRKSIESLSQRSLHRLSEKSWKYSLAYRLQGNRGRASCGKSRGVFSGDLLSALRQLKTRRRWFEESDWKKKVANKLSNMRKRRKRKHEIAKAKGCICWRDDAETDRQPIQVCFDWMGSSA